MEGNENYTALNGKKNVAKDHPMIQLRGKLDSLYGIITLAGAKALELGIQGLAKDLASLGECCFSAISAGVKEEDVDVEAIQIMGMSWEEIHTLSHEPQRFSLQHFLPTAQDGVMMNLLNICRCTIRETECLAVGLFQNQWPGFILLLNRMSSAAYVIMCRYKAGIYQEKTD